MADIKLIHGDCLIEHEQIESGRLEHRRATCKTRNKLGYCNVPDEDCPKCKAYDYEPLDLIVGLTWEEIQAKQHRIKQP